MGGKKFVEKNKEHRSIDHNEKYLITVPRLPLFPHSPFTSDQSSHLKTSEERWRERKKKEREEEEEKKKSSIKSILLKGKSGRKKKQGGRDEEQSMEGRFLEIEAPLGIRNPVEKCRWARRFPRIIIGNKRKKGFLPAFVHFEFLQIVQTSTIRCQSWFFFFF